MTNLIATIIVSVTTNVYHPTQYKVIRYYATNPETIVESWVDSSYGLGNAVLTSHESSPLTETRDNPDVRIVAVVQTRTLVFTFEGKRYEIKLSQNTLSKKREVRSIQETWKKESKESR